MSKYIVDNIVGLYGVFVSTDKELIVSCKRKENAELIADVLNADKEDNVYGMTDCSSSLLAHLLNCAKQRVKLTKEEAEQMVKTDAERKKRGEQEYNEQRIDNIEKRIECLENAFKDCQKRNGITVPLFACVCNPVERFYGK